MTYQILLREIRLPRARIFRREPYLVGTILTGTTAGKIPFHTVPVRGVKRGRPAVFDPPVILAAAEDFGGHVSGEIMLVDSDEDFRRLGEKLHKVRKAIGGASKLATLVQAGAPEILAARAALKPALDVLEKHLRKAQDDIMGRFEIFLDEEDGYRAGELITLASTRCEVDIEIVGPEVAEPDEEWGPEFIRSLLEDLELLQTKIFSALDRM